MATSSVHLSKSSHCLIFTSSLVFFCLFNSCLAFRHKHLNLSARALHWSSAGATWYGSPDGAGSDGGACGYGNLMSQAPFSSLVTGIGPSLYKSGKECGACYQIKCTKHRSCSRRPVRVVITDFCPGGLCLSDSAHFDLSGTAFGAMAIRGQEDRLRDAGVLQIRFARVACDYSGKTIAFHVDPGSNPNYFAAVIEFEEGDGDLGRVDLQQASGEPDEWWEMNQSWGAVWQLNPGSELHPPFSIRLISQYSGQTLVAKHVIPKGWQPGRTYRSVVNYL
ncbi:UNVERIFIED_CONTAM: Expansin-B15 [Sesamum latifolium]|uniref:Expansin-B15 n=1 Tax=Sesamum latifolium TaxID=2727402 RepID=A0AAW2T9L1_9LAMI